MLSPGVATSFNEPTLSWLNPKDQCHLRFFREQNMTNCVMRMLQGSGYSTEVEVVLEVVFPQMLSSGQPLLPLAPPGCIYFKLYQDKPADRNIFILIRNWFNLEQVTLMSNSPHEVSTPTQQYCHDNPRIHRARLNSNSAFCQVAAGTSSLGLRRCGCRHPNCKPCCNNTPGEIDICVACENNVCTKCLWRDEPDAGITLCHQ